MPSRIAHWVLGFGLLIAAAMSSNDVTAQGRHIIVNGVLMNPQQVQVLDYMAGAYVPDGSYWLNMVTGVWGYAGDPRPRGRIGDGNGGGGGGNYSGQNYRGPFGDYMSDGNCSFVNGIPVGNC